jgi:hypothetical protein
MTDEDPVIVRLNVAYYQSLLQLDRLTEGERRTVANLLGECETKLAAATPELKQPQPNAVLAVLEERLR